MELNEIEKMLELARETRKQIRKVFGERVDTIYWLRLC